MTASQDDNSMSRAELKEFISDSNEAAEVYPGVLDTDDEEAFSQALVDEEPEFEEQEVDEIVDVPLS